MNEERVSATFALPFGRRERRSGSGGGGSVGFSTKFSNSKIIKRVNSWSGQTSFS